MLDLKCLEGSVVSNIPDIYQQSLGNSIDSIDIILGGNIITG